jgi:hypothetical protein
MSRLLLVTALVSLCTACASSTTRTSWTKYGAGDAAFRGDSSRCEVVARQQFPDSGPPRRADNYQTDCIKTGGSYDCRTVNLGGGRGGGLAMQNYQNELERSRKASFTACMYGLGWQLQ